MGPFNDYVRTQGWVGDSGNGNFPLHTLCTENVLTGVICHSKNT